MKTCTKRKHIRNKNMYKIQTNPKQKHEQNANKSETKTYTKRKQSRKKNMYKLKTNPKGKHVQNANMYKLKIVFWKVF